MPSCTDRILPKILDSRLADLDLGAQGIHPHYAGLSILNLPSSISRWFDAAPLPHPPLDLPEIDELAHGARQVVVTLVDALSFDRFLDMLAGPAGELGPWIERGLLAPLTSVVPSTTSTALTCLWTGRSPAEHGILGYELWLREYGLIANMITLSPASFEQPGFLEKAGFRPEEALPVPTLGPLLAPASVEVHAFIAYGLGRTGLSRMHYAGVQVHGFADANDLWLGVRDLVKLPLANRRLIWIYYGEIDTLSHRHGPDSDQVRRALASFVSQMGARFIREVPRELASDIVLVLLADHGQIATSPDPHFDLMTHPGFARRLHLPPTGENRLAYVYARPGHVQAAVDYLTKNWPGAFRLLLSGHALEAGLFGPGKPCRNAASRLGDLILTAEGHAYLWWSAKPNNLLGRHGGVSREEMLVPLVAFRLAD